MIEIEKVNNDEILRYTDGVGREVKRKQTDCLTTDPDLPCQWTERPVQYYVRSTVLGGEVLSEVNNTGKKLKTYIRAAGAVIAWQTVFHQTTGNMIEGLVFEHEDASGMSRRMTDSAGATITTPELESSPAEFDATGGSVGLYNPYPDLNTISLGEGCIGCGSDGIMTVDDNSPIMVNGQRMTATLDGARVNYLSLMSLNGLGISAQCPDNNCGAKVFRLNGQNALSLPFQAYADGTSGYRVPVWASVNVLNDDGTIYSAGKPGIVDWIFREYSSNDKPLLQADCDKFIASLFGGAGAVVSTAIEPSTIKSTSELVNGKRIYTNTATEPGGNRSGHLANDGVFHIYPDKFGTDSLEVGLFVPKGAIVKKLVGEREQKIKGKGTGSWTNTFAFYFVSGEYKGVEIWFDHVGGTYGGNYESQNLGNEFINKNNKLIGPTNSAGSQQVGFIGGLGGRQNSEFYKNPLYRHTHTTVKRNGRRIDPRKVFCGWK